MKSLSTSKETVNLFHSREGLINYCIVLLYYVLDIDVVWSYALLTQHLMLMLTVT